MKIPCLRKYIPTYIYIHRLAGFTQCYFHTCANYLWILNVLCCNELKAARPTTWHSDSLIYKWNPHMHARTQTKADMAWWLPGCRTPGYGHRGEPPWACLLTWFCYQLILKPCNKRGSPPRPYLSHLARTKFLMLLLTTKWNDKQNDCTVISSHKGTDSLYAYG